MKKVFFVIQILIALSCYSNEMLDYYNNEASKYGFELIEKVKEPKQLNIRKLNRKDLYEHWDIFLNFIKKYDIDFRKFQINSISFVKSIKQNGEKHFGYRIGHDIYLTNEYIDFVFFHEMYHIIDIDYKNDEWIKINLKNFKYGEKTSKDFKPHFIRRYSQTSICEDKADIFAFMLKEGKNFLKRCEKSNIIKQKMFLMITETIERDLITKDFWEKHLEIDLSNIL